MSSENPSAYWNSITDRRAAMLDPEESLRGETLISVETEGGQQDADLFVFIENYAEKFFELLRRLPALEQEQLVCYFILSGTQTRLCVLWNTTQTLLSQRLRRAICVFAATILFGSTQVPQEKMREIFMRQNMEIQKCLAEDAKTEMALSMSGVFAWYMATKSFSSTAHEFKAHRASMRRAMGQVARILAPDNEAGPANDPEAAALGNVLRLLVDGSDPKGQGRSTRHRSKEGDVRLRDADVLGFFRVDLSDPSADDVFVSAANR